MSPFLSDAVPGDEAGEMRERPVICPLRIVGEAAGGKLPAFQVVLQAFTAGPLPGTGLVAAVAVQPVLIQLTIHSTHSFKMVPGY